MAVPSPFGSRCWGSPTLLGAPCHGCINTVQPLDLALIPAQAFGTSSLPMHVTRPEFSRLTKLMSVNWASNWM